MLDNSLKALSVSELVFAIKEHVENEFPSVIIEGEVTNFSISSSGHAYFSLSDEESLISAVMFKGDLLRNPGASKVKNGLTVRCQAQLSVYNKRGTFQLIVRSISTKGVGNLQEQFEKLKQKMQGEGLFEANRKKTIPELPERVAILTAESGAALQDFIEVYSRRCIFMDIVIVPVLVQGEKAPLSILSGLEQVLTMHRIKKIDVVVLARGGGSLEDLWAFNDEKLCRYLANYSLPTISAVGHQTDFSLADFVCDKRAETPTAAAQILTEAQVRLIERLSLCQRGLQYWLEKTLNRAKSRLAAVRPRYVYELLLGRISLLRRRLDTLYSLRQIEKFTNFHGHRLFLDELKSRMISAQKQLMSDRQSRIKILETTLAALNPKQVLTRGFCYLEQDDKIISSKSEFSSLQENSAFSITFADGKAGAWKKS